MSTRRLARRTFGVLALLVGLMAAWHLYRGTAAGGAGDPAWPHFVLGSLYLVGAAGLLLRPRGFVVFFGLITLYAVGATLVNAWKAVRGPEDFSGELLLGFIVFPLALNLLMADEIHERTVEMSRPAI